MMFTRVLVPLAPTADAATPLSLACRIAVATKTSVTLICTVPGALTLRDPRCDTAEAAARHLLNAFPDEVPNTFAIAVLPLPPDTDLASRLATEVATRPGSLIVLGRYEGVGQSGSTGDDIVEAILAKSPDPVILVRPDAGSMQAAGLAGGIVVPLDGTMAGAAAIEPAVQLASAFGGEIFLLRVVEPSETAASSAALRGIAVEPALQADHFAFADARHYIDEQVRWLRSRGLVVHGRAVFGATSATILETAHRLGAGMIAMSTHLIAPDRPRFAAGSVGAAIARQADCPVLLIRRNESHLAMAHGAASAERV